MPTVVTSFGPSGYHLYGKRFLDSFATFWPAGVPLVCYVESPISHPRAEMRDLFAVEPCRSFLAEHRSSPVACGRKPVPGWRPKDREEGYSYRFDAVKFCRKVFAISDAASRIESGILTWLDADVVTTAPVPCGWVGALLDHHDVAFLGRRGTHSECGFLAFRLPQARPVIEALAAIYSTGSVFRESEWHDSYLFDRIRNDARGITFRDLTPGGYGHVWVRSPLAAYTDHLKGDRKQLLRSPEIGAAP
jgi:hypothetical protein